LPAGENGDVSGVEALADPIVRDVLHRGRQLYVAVTTQAGPHVTPELYAVGDDRLWFWTAHDTLKAKVLGDGEVAGVLVRVGDRVVLASGPTQRIDLRSPGSVPSALGDLARAGRATVDFGLRNAADLGAFASDFVKGRLGRSVPPRRVLIALAPERVALLDAGRVLESWGAWEAVAAVGTWALAGDEGAVVAWHSAAGPLALPARAQADGRTAWLPSAVVALAGPPVDDGAAIVVDRYVAPGPAAKEGLLVRGRATLTDEGDKVRLDVDPERETAWSGVVTKTTKR
jgi:hypothetical protein